MRSLCKLLPTVVVFTGLLCAAGARTAVAQSDDLGCGLHANSLQRLYAHLEGDEHHDLKGIAVLCKGKRVSEVHFNGDSAETLHDIRSATKSITATLMGIAIQRGLVHSVNDPIALYLPGLPRDGKQNITIHDLLTMRSGLAADDEDPLSPGNEDNLDKASDWLTAALAVPVKEPPGRTYLYCSLNAFLTGVIVSNAAKMPLEEFARLNLFNPLGIGRFDWLKAAGGKRRVRAICRSVRVILRQSGRCISITVWCRASESWTLNGSSRAGQSWSQSPRAIPTQISMVTCGTRVTNQPGRVLHPFILLREMVATRSTSCHLATLSSPSLPARMVTATVSGAHKAFS